MFYTIKITKVKSVLILKNVTIAIDNKIVVQDLSISVPLASSVLIQGKNGSGKSSLLNALAGHPFYSLSGDIFSYENNSFLEKSPLERSQAGLFLVPQNPPALPGVQLSTFLQESFRALCSHFTLEEYQERLVFALSFLELSQDFIAKPLHEHFSGGEKKRCELLQLMVLRPSLVLLDELDSGLDKMGIELFMNFLEWYKKVVPEAVIIIVTHSQSLAEKITVDVRYSMDQGRLYDAT